MRNFPVKKGTVILERGKTAKYGAGTTIFLVLDEPTHPVRRNGDKYWSCYARCLYCSLSHVGQEYFSSNYDIVLNGVEEDEWSPGL